MSVIRKHHNKNYTVMSNYHFMDRALSLKAKGLLSLMLSLPEDWDYSTVGLECLSSDGNTSVRNALKELEEHEYLIRERVYEKGKIVDWEYHIFECAEDCKDYKEENSKQSDNLHDEKQHVADNNNKVRKQSSTKKEKNSSKEELHSQEFQFGKQSKPKKANLYTKCANMINDFTDNEMIRSDLHDYLYLLMEMRKDGKSFYTNTWKGLLRKLKEISSEPNIQHDSILYSMQKGYIGFYDPKDRNFSFKSADIRKGKAWEEGLSCETYTEEEKRQIEKERAEREARGEKVWY